MTSAQLFRPGRLLRRSRAGLLLLLIGATIAGCARPASPRMTILRSPYAERQLWAVAPFTNESGVTVVDPARTADLFAEEIQQTPGIDVLPVNRVLAAMRELGMPAVRTVGDARTLMNVLEVDGLVAGTVTAYDPYRPLRFGAAVQLFSVEQNDRYRGLDSRTLTLNTNGEIAPGGLDSSLPVAQAAGVFDAANHQTLARLNGYAAGRTEPDSAYGREIFLVDMELYTQFVSHVLLRDLFDDERMRRAMAARSP